MRSRRPHRHAPSATPLGKPNNQETPLLVPDLRLPDPISPANGNPQSAWYSAVFYYLSLVLAALYLIWALLPEEKLHALGLVWYPKREWALLLPSWLTMAVVFTYLFYAAINIHDTPAEDALAQMVDNQGHIQEMPPPGQTHPLIKNSYAALPKGSIPALHDVPLGIINEAMFGEANLLHSQDDP